jgi:hypothetical protein
MIWYLYLWLALYKNGLEFLIVFCPFVANTIRLYFSILENINTPNHFQYKRSGSKKNLTFLIYIDET